MDQRVDLLIRVSSDDAPGIWPQIEQYIHDANQFTGGKFHVKHWLIKILGGQADLWTTPTLDAAIIGEALQFPARRVYTVSLIGGDGGNDWVAVEAQLEARARELGCSLIENLARPGWKNVAKACDYRVAHWVYRKELD